MTAGVIPGLQGRIYANKKEVVGFNFIDDRDHVIEPPEELAVTTKWVRNNADKGFLTLENTEWVVRPSRTNPEYDTKGSAVVPVDHLAPESGLPQPHILLHVETMVFQTRDHGEVRYTVVHQPDKYVEDDDEARVTREVYEAGKTRVDHFYIIRKES